MTSAEEARTPSRRLWSLDEYVVAADLFLRRGRSSGVHDPEVLALAHLTGRTPASISRRLGNFAGTKTPGVGLKPVTGEALAAFQRMQTDASTRELMVREAHFRLSQSMEADLPASTSWRLVPPEQVTAERFHREVATSDRESERREAALVLRYRDWLDPDGTRLFGVAISAPQQTLRADLFDRELRLLIEAKADAERDSIRYAIGQLFDYRRFIVPRPRLAVLVPSRPSKDLIGLLRETGIDAIWPIDHWFTDTAQGAYTCKTRPGAGGDAEA